MEETLKLHHNLNFDNARMLTWYTGLYLGLPRVFMSIVRKKVVHHPNVDSVLIPLHIVRDPVTGKPISINITDRYFFIGTLTQIDSEFDIGLQSHINTITLLRNKENSYKPTKITVSAIQQVIDAHIKKRRTTIQEDVSVFITGGTFKDWYGTVQKKSSDDLEHIRVKFISDEYDYVTKMPTALCKAAC